MNLKLRNGATRIILRALTKIGFEVGPVVAVAVDR